MAAQNNVNIGINISDNGTAGKTLKNVKDLHSELKATQKTAQSISPGAVKATMAPGGTSGSRGASAPTGSQAMTGQQYGQMRGSAGTTGASARDFANQAQGLGGLVRVYATFAANLFAVTAAFSALKNAADTTNMIKGLDQLGAQSGRSLGTLAQELVKATDGAVSLREAMTATAQTTAAGMSGENLKRLAAGAKNVSQALGVAMPDALSRLSRGITKLEPELLDELGIFVRVDDASQKYARSIGKAAAGLTDFEKRGAFAAEVLSQLEQKFGAINLQANPYDQLLSSLKNVAQAGLELINKFLGPVAKLLAESPAGLATALAAVSAVLLKQAIPELGAMKKRMADAATQAREIANIKVAEAQKGLAKEVAANKSAADVAAQVRVDAIDSAEAKLRNIVKQSNTEIKKSSKEVFQVLSKESIQMITDEDIARINKLAQGGGKVGKVYGEIATAIKQAKDADIAYDATVKAGNESLTKRHSLFTTIGQLQASAARANSQAASREAINLASQTAAVEGIGSGWAKLNEQIKAGKMSGELGMMRAGWTRLAGGVAIATTAVGTFMNALGPWMMLIGLAVTAISFLVDYLSATKKESKATAESLQSLEGALSNVDRTITAIAAKSPFESFTVESIQARSTALKELADTVKGLVTNSFKELDRMNELDKFINKVKGMFGKDVQTELSEGLSSSIVEALKVTENTGALESFKILLKDTLNIESFDLKAITEAFGKMSTEVAKQKIPLITKALEEVAKQSSITAAKGLELKQAFAAAGLIFKDLANTYLPVDNVSKLGMAMVESATKLDLALEDPVQSLNAMREVTKDIASLSLFPPATANELVGITDKVNDMVKAMSEAKSVIKSNEIQIEALNAKAAELKETLGGSGLMAALKRNQPGGSSTAEMLKELTDIEEKIKNINSVSQIKTTIVAKLTTETEGLKTVFKEAIFQQMKAGAELVGSRIAAEWQKATAAVNSAVAGLLGDSLAGVRLKAQNDRQMIDAQVAVIKTQLDLITSNEKLAIQLELNRIAAEKANMDPRDIRLNKLGEREQGLELRSSYLSGKVEKGTSTKLAGEMSKGTEGAKEALQFVQRVEATLAQIAILAGQRVALAITEQAGVLKATASLEKEGLESAKIKNDIELSILSTKEQIGEKLSIEQEASRVTLINANLELDSKKQLKDLDTEIAIKRLALANTQDIATKALIASDITRLDTQNRLNITTKNQAEVLKNSLVLEEKRAIRARELADAYLEIKNIIASTKFAKEGSDLEEMQIRLDTAKQIENITDSQYIIEKQSLDLSNLKLDSEKKIYELQESGVKKFQVLTDKYAKEQDTDRKKAIAAEIKANEESLKAQIDGVNIVSAAKLDGINKVAAYELQNTDLYNGLADAVYINVTQGGEAGAKAMRSALEKELRKPFNLVIKALIQPVVAGLSKLFDNFLGSFTADLASGISLGMASIIPLLIDGIKGAITSPMDSLSKVFGIFKSGMDVFKSFGGVTSELGGIFNSAQELISGNATLAKSLGTTAGSQQTSMLAAQEAGMSGSSASTFGGVFSGAGNLASQALIGTAVGKKLSGGYSVSGKSGNAAVNIGTVVGSLIPGIGTLLGGVVGGLANRIFGKKITTTAQGIEGTFGGESGFEGRTFTTTRKKRFLRRARVSTSYGALDEETRSGLGGAFNAIKSETADLAKSLGIGTDSIQNFTKNVKFDLKGLSQEQITKKFNDELAVMQESMAQLALGTTEYNKEGENSTDALKRLSTNLKGTNSVFDMLGQTVLATSLDGALAAQDFVDAFGSLDEFMQSTGFFYDKFFSDEHKAAKATEQLTKAFDEYGLVLPKTREEFVGIVDELQKVGDTEAYAAVLKLAPALDGLLPAMGEVGKGAVALATQLTESTKNLTSQILALTKSDSEIQSINRADILSGTDPAIIALQQYVFALEDVKKASDAAATATAEKLRQDQINQANALKEQQNILKSSITALSQYSASLKKFKQSLLLDSLSPLTPAQRYSEAKSQFDAILSTATGTAVTPDELKAKQSALGELESASKSFLDASKIYNASSEKYTQDFNKVQNALTDSTSSIDAQLSIEERTYALAEEQISILSTINTSVLSLADTLINLSSAQSTEAIAKAKAFIPMTTEEVASKGKELLSSNTALSYSDLLAEGSAKYKIDPAAMSAAITPEDFKKIRGFATGGLANGLAVVGENGREFVDFNTPGRVYTNEQTEGMFLGGNRLGEVVQELKQLRTEVSQLRAQQQTETGHLITATYDAQSRNAEEVSKAVTDSANKQVWTAKVKESVVLA